jgi:hypothetical protein
MKDGVRMGRFVAVLVCAMGMLAVRADSLYDYTTSGLNVTYSGSTLGAHQIATSSTLVTIDGTTLPGSVSTTNFTLSGTTSTPGGSTVSSASLAFQLADGTKIDNVVFLAGFFDQTGGAISQFAFSSFHLNGATVNSSLTLQLSLSGAVGSGVSAESNLLFTAPTAAPLPSVSLAGLSLIGGFGALRRRNRRAA